MMKVYLLVACAFIALSLGSSINLAVRMSHGEVVTKRYQAQDVLFGVFLKVSALAWTLYLLASLT